MEHIGLSFPDDKIIYALPEEAMEIPVGSLPDNTIYLPFRGVSRHHCTLIRKDDRVWVRDEKSHNGTFLNDAKVQESPLSDGDHIRTGIVSLTFFTEKTSREVSLRLPRLPVESAPGWKSLDTQDVSDDNCDLEDEIYFFPHMLFPEGTVLGCSSSMFTSYHKISLSAKSNLPVLFLGELGVGKRHFARALHLSGPDAAGPFVTCDCGETDPARFEEILFGKGEGMGVFTEASGGTLFLENVEILPLSLQEHTFRFLQDNASSKSFRLITTLGDDPDRLLNEHRLHKNLYYNIAGIHIPMPPLRQRQVDLKCFIGAFLDVERRENGKEIPGVTGRLMEALTAFTYPDNLVELKSVIREMVAVALPKEMLDIQNLPARVANAAVKSRIEARIRKGLDGNSLNLQALLDEITCDAVAQVLAVNMGNLGKTAVSLGLTREDLTRMMAWLKITT